MRNPRFILICKAKMEILGYINQDWLIVLETRVKHLKQSPFICLKLKLMAKV